LDETQFSGDDQLMKQRTPLNSVCVSSMKPLLAFVLLLSACSRYSSTAPASPPAQQTTPFQDSTNSTNTAKAASEIERRTIHFSGTVQGVGFRNTTVELSSGMQLAGTVRNLADGRVELIVEGTPTDIEKLVTRLRERFGSFIRNLEQTTSTPQGLAPGVRVTY
jgi:acylphosphatase